jgi:hypothetical protein
LLQEMLAVTMIVGEEADGQDMGSGWAHEDREKNQAE